MGKSISILVKDRFALYSDSQDIESIVDWFQKTDLTKLQSNVSEGDSTLRFLIPTEQVSNLLRDEIKPMISFFSISPAASGLVSGGLVPVPLPCLEEPCSASSSGTRAAARSPHVSSRWSGNERSCPRS
jgi:hypothetical protein